MILFDAQIFRTINDAAGQRPWFDALGIFSAKHLIFVMAAAIIAAAVIGWDRRRQARLSAGLWSRLAAVFRRRPGPEPSLAAAVRALLAASLAALGNRLFSLLWFRPRPCQALRDVHQMIVKDCSDKSFPSDHSSVAFALAFSVAFVHPAFGLALLAAAALVAWGRVFVGVHYPLDVITGFAVGLFWALVARAFDRRNDLTGALIRLIGRLRARLKP